MGGRRKSVDEPCFHVYYWMAELGIRGEELLVYALIYSLTEECGRCDLSQARLSQLTGASLRTVGYILRRLTDRGLIAQPVAARGRGKACGYVAVADTVKYAKIADFSEINENTQKLQVLPSGKYAKIAGFITDDKIVQNVGDQCITGVPGVEGNADDDAVSPVPARVNVNVSNTPSFIDIAVNDNVKNNISPDSNTQARATAMITNDRAVDILCRQQIWMEAVAKKHRISLDETRRRLDEFALSNEVRGVDTHNGLRDLKSHFDSWLTSVLRTERRDAAAKAQPSQFQERMSELMSDTRALEERVRRNRKQYNAQGI